MLARESVIGDDGFAFEKPGERRDEWPSDCSKTGATHAVTSFRIHFSRTRNTGNSKYLNFNLPIGGSGSCALARRASEARQDLASSPHVPAYRCNSVHAFNGNKVETCRELRLKSGWRGVLDMDVGGHIEIRPHWPVRHRHNRPIDSHHGLKFQKRFRRGLARNEMQQKTRWDRPTQVDWPGYPPFSAKVVITDDAVNEGGRTARGDRTEISI